MKNMQLVLNLTARGMSRAECGTVGKHTEERKWNLKY